MAGALDGIRVLEFGQIIAGPFCGVQLADLGADVVKVEPPGGEAGRQRRTVLEGETLSVTLPDIHLTGIGRDKGGATPAEVLDRVIGAVGQAVASLGLGEMLGAVKEQAAGATQALAKEPAGARDLLDKGAKDAGGALKKLLGN